MNPLKALKHCRYPRRHGDSIEVTTSSHDLAFRALLDRCRERVLKLNKKKLHFKLSKVDYMGHVLGADGLQTHSENN